MIFDKKLKKNDYSYGLEKREYLSANSKNNSWLITFNERFWKRKILIDNSKLINLKVITLN